jgi:hypothetical protein
MKTTQAKYLEEHGERFGSGKVLKNHKNETRGRKNPGKKLENMERCSTTTNCF